MISFEVLSLCPYHDVCTRRDKQSQENQNHLQRWMRCFCASKNVAKRKLEAIFLRIAHAQQVKSFKFTGIHTEYALCKIAMRENHRNA